MSSETFDVVAPGLETSVQDLPGRIGYWEQGFPPSGPIDAWSFRLANLLVGNAPEAAALECQFLGPTLRFRRDTAVALAGADMTATLDGEPVAAWTSFAVRKGQTLKMAAALAGARAYIAVAGGLDTPPVLGSRSTFHMAGVGGIDGKAIQAGQSIATGEGEGTPGRTVRPDCRPAVDGGPTWEIEVVPGPNDDWIDETGRERFLSSDWVLQSKSNRTGYRLQGPEWSFSDVARNKRPEHGQDPSNILDHGYPLGAVNLASQTPIILVNDGPSTGGFINPYTVVSAAFWKLAQSRPWDVYRFRAVTLQEAGALRREMMAKASPQAIEPLG